jgi:hypothetical protein
MTLFACYIFLLLCFAASGDAISQPIRLKSRTFEPEKNINSFDGVSLAKKNSQFEGKSFVVLQFSKIPSATEKVMLKEAGIELQQYVPDNAYTAVITGTLKAEVLKQYNAVAVFELAATDKMSHRLTGKNSIPAWAKKEHNKVDVIVHYNSSVSASLPKEYFIQQSYQIVDESWKEYHFITLRVDEAKLISLASTPFVTYVEPVAPDPKTFNYVMRANTRANVLNADVASGGEGLKGKGVTIGIGDDADPTNHVDLRDRVINRAAGVQNTHGTHVAGIAAGGGIKDPMLQGVAPLATIVSQLFNGIFLNAAAYIADYNMVVTNNSWGNITGECDLAGVYDTYSKLMDDLSIRYPFLLHVFAAGNDGTITCFNYPQGYKTIVSGHQSSKNVLSVAWGEKNQSASLGSSVGPTADGRIKPEIMSQGSGLRSTIPVDDYLTDWGTSMAAPTVAGGGALLIEKYRQMHNGADPKSGLVKALLMNGARDIENPAPDFKSGYGFLNLVRSLDMLKNNRHITSTVSNAATNNHNINVPAGVAQLKVMIYWHDPSAAIFAQQALVNDLDLEVTSTASSTVLPWSLNASFNGVNTNAVRAADHVNNSEQVTIDNPAAGNYTIRVKGTKINSGNAQEYFIVYDYVPVGVDLTYPSVGEPMVPGEPVVINWDLWGGPANNFTLEYSVDGGTTWIIIDNNIPANARQYNWTPPTITDRCKVRITKNGTSFTDESAPFVVLHQTSVSLSTVQCEDYISINWAPIAGATDYEVMMKRGVEMVSVDTTTNTNHIFSNLHRDSTYYVTVRGRINGKPGRRAIAVSRRPNSGNCSGNISDNDLKIDSILSPLSGRKFTSTEITANSLAVRIRNLDDAPATGFTVSYSLNGAPFMVNNVAATIPANGTYNHTFTGLNFSAAGDYHFVVVVKNSAADVSTKNDTASVTIRQLPNNPITLPHIENFDATPIFEVRKDTMGLPSLDKWDFINSTDFGRIRSFVNTGIAKSGNRAITMDVVQFTPSGNTNYLIGTFNLSNYSATPAADVGLTLEFSYKHHGQVPHPNNRVWARRSDTDAWIEIFSFDSLQLLPGEWRTVAINLSNTAAAINPTSSFQIRFGQHGRLSMGDNVSNAGITIDDVKLLSNPSDVELISIETPVAQGCDTRSATITIKYKDHRVISTCIPVKYRINGGNIISECAVSTGLNSTYTFNNKLVISAFGEHLLEVWIDHPNDNYRSNDTVRKIIYNKPIVKTFPYYENFENGKGYWHAEGFRSSWEYGTPASRKINRAASGTKAWKTTLQGQYNEGEESYLYSPCFNISALQSPFLSFDIAMDIEQCTQFLCDRVWMEYSADGKTWTKLGAYGQGVNWYNRRNDNVWDSANYTNWHVAGIALPTGFSQLQLRFVLVSDAGVVREGIAIDDVHIYEQNMNVADVQWRVYPNPTSTSASLLTSHTSGRRVNMQLFNAAGQLIHQQSFTASGFLDNTSVDLSTYSKGVFLLKVDDGSKQQLFKLVKQ